MMNVLKMDQFIPANPEISITNEQEDMKEEVGYEW